MRQKERKEFSLYKRNGIYYCRVWDETAGRYSSAKSTGENDRDKAAVEANRMIKDGEIKLREEDPLFLDLYLKYWQTRTDLSANYRRDVFHFYEIHFKQAKTLQKLRMSKITAPHLNRLIDGMKAGGETPRMINRIMQNVKTFLRWSESRGYVTRDFTRQIEIQKVRLRERGALTPSEVFTLANIDFPDIRVKAAALLGIFSGLRRGEALGLQWQDVDFESRMIHVRRNFTGQFDGQGNAVFTTPKMDSSGSIPSLRFPELRKVMLDVLNETAFKLPTDLCLTNIWERRRKNGTAPDGQIPMSYTTLKRGFTGLLEAIGIDSGQQEERHLTFHGTRHTFATIIAPFVRGDIGRRLTRHSSNKMLEHYQHRDENAVVEAIEEINRAFDVYRGSTIQ